MLKKLTAYFYLMRWHRPIGSWLLLWPTLIALWIAGQGKPDLKWILIFSLGVFLMRAAGCIINDLADKDFDGHVERTKTRPLVTGEVSILEAKCLFFFVLSLAGLLLLFTDPLVIGLSFVGAALTIIYPFLKRVTHYPQICLGFAFAWGIPMAFAAQKGSLPLECWLLFLASVLWIIAFDTLYAMADREDDIKIGVKSTAIAFGKHDKRSVAGLQGLMLGVLIGLGWYLGLHWSYFISLVVILGLVFYQQWLVKTRDRKKCLEAFLNNQWVGMVLFIGVVLGISSC